MALSGMSYNTPLTSTTEYGVAKIGTGLSVTNGVISASTGLLNYGFFTDSTTQTNPVANAVNIATYNTTGPTNGVSVVAGTQITVANAGTYTELFTLIIDKTAGGTSTISVWIRLNGVDIVGSRQDLSLTNTLPLVFTSGNFTLTIPASGNTQLCWSSSDITVTLATLPAAVTPTRPTGNSAKVTLTRIS